MIKKILMIVICSCVSAVSIQAQHAKLSREEFKSKQREFITEKAELTDDEAARFFPVYFELQDKKKELNDKVWTLMRSGKRPETTEEEYGKILEEMADLRIAIDKLDKDYLKKFRKILTAKQLYRIKREEMRFHRELLKPMKHRKNKTPR